VPPWRLRPDLLRAPGPDGGLQLVDLLLDRAVPLDAAQAAALDRGDPALGPWLDAMLLAEGPAVDAIRAQVAGARLRPDPAPAPPGPPRPVDPAALADLPAAVAPAWRAAGPWARAAEAHRAGEPLLRLDGLLTAEAAAALAAAGPPPDQRLDTDIVSGWRAPVADDHPAVALFGHPALRRLLGGAAGLALDGPLQLQRWRLDPGDAMRVHPDGITYRLTLVLGLNPGWTADQGGAIAFGRPGDGPFEAHARWLPQLGDVLAFRPGPLSFHAVEPPAAPRHTLSGWFLP
jgi:hypothetical protein